MDVTRNAWVKAGTAVSLAALAWAFLRGHRTTGRLAAGFAGAFLEKWRDLRLERKVGEILDKAGSPGNAETRAGLGRLWGNP